LRRDSYSRFHCELPPKAPIWTPNAPDSDFSLSLPFFSPPPILFESRLFPEDRSRSPTRLSFFFSFFAPLRLGRRVKILKSVLQHFPPRTSIHKNSNTSTCRFPILMSPWVLFSGFHVVRNHLLTIQLISTLNFVTTRFAFFCARPFRIMPGFFFFHLTFT